MAAVQIDLFGGLRIAWRGQPVTSVNTSRLQSLLSYLILHADGPVSREHLAFLLWPESNESQARTNLRQLLHHLRRALPHECTWLISDNQTAQWQRAPECAVDIWSFEALLASAEAARKNKAAKQEAAALTEAAAAYSDDLVPALYDDWLQPKRDHYRQQLATALTRLAALAEEAGDYAGAIPHAERLVALDPLRETNHQLLIRLHAGNKDRASALRAYHQCMRVLRREMGVEPGAATRELFERLLRSEPSAAAQKEAPPTETVVALPIVGRRKEWDALADSWRAALRGGTHLAVIEGEPGIGKSRLAEELCEWLGRDGVHTARTRCYAGRGQLAFAPVADWLRAEPLRASRSALALSQLTELTRLVPEILDEKPALDKPQPLAESWERLRFYDSLNAAFARAAKPLLLFIDDAQWCDRDSFEWMHSLFRSESCGQILVVATLRPEEAGRDHPFGKLLAELRQSGQTTVITLAPLSADDAAALALQTAGRALKPTELAELYRTAKGHPLFVIESVRAGVGADGASAPPSRVQAVIAARLSQLTTASYELAGLAATIGRPFSSDLLAKASDWDEDSLTRALDELWQRRIIEGHGASEYDFTHDRLREVAYAELSLVRRRYLHRRVARALEETQTGDPEGRATQLAAHYEAAGMAEEAIRNFREAAEVARRRYADEESAAMLQRALALCNAFPESAARRQQELELRVALGPVLVTTLGYAMPEVGENYERALALSRQLEDEKNLFFVLSGSWVFHVVRGALEKSRELGREFLDLAVKAGSPELSMAGNFLVGSSLFHLGRFQASFGHMEKALEQFGGGPHPVLAMFAGPDVGVFCRSYIGHLSWHLDSDERAVVSIDEAIRSANKVGHPFSMAIALDYSAMLQVFRQNSRAALPVAEEASALCRKHRFAYYGAIAEILAGWASAMESTIPADALPGVARLRQGLETMRATGAEIRLPFYYGLLAEACWRAGLQGEALANLSTGFAFQSKNGEVWAAADLHRIHGDLMNADRNGDQARASYQKALEAAQHSGSKAFAQRAASLL